jgi:hypothetical protein
MEKVSTRKSAVLEVLDEQIELLEKKLVKVQPLVDELNQLKKTRATLLSERTTTGGLGGRTRLNMESVIHALRENDNDPMTPSEIASAIGTDDTVVRSHLNRHADVRYRKNGDGKWHLIGEDNEEGE